VEPWLFLVVSCLALFAAAALAPRDRMEAASRPTEVSPRVGAALVVRCGVAGAVLLLVHDAQRPAEGALSCLAFALGVAAAVCAGSVAGFLAARQGARWRVSAAVGISGMAFTLSGAALVCLAVLLGAPALRLPQLATSGPVVFPAYALGVAVAGASDLLAVMALESAAALVAACALYDANWDRLGIDAGPAALGLLVFPLVVRALGIVASLVGLVLPNATWAAVALAGAGVVGASFWSLGPYWLPFALAGATGALIAGGVARLSRLEGGEPRPAWLSLLAVAVVTVTSYELGEQAGLSGGGFFGSACASSGALAMSGYALGLGAGEGEPAASGRERDGYAAAASALASTTGVLAWIELATRERAARWAEHAQLPTRSIGELAAQYAASGPPTWTVRPHAMVTGMLAGAALVLWARSRGATLRTGAVAMGLLVATGIVFRFVLDGGLPAVASMLASALAVIVALGLGIAGDRGQGASELRWLLALLVAAALALAPLLA
jgi:hypothetical protein